MTTSKLSMAATTNPNCMRLFQFYMDTFFKFPKEIKNDIIYCQRALKAHISVHQMVLDVFQQQPDADPLQKKRILNELETEIYEINAEQHFLFLRLRRVIDEFYKMLKKNGVPIDQNATNAIISKEIIPLISDTSVEILPITVLFRNTEEKLIEKYFEIQKEQQHFEVIDLDNDGKVLERVEKSQVKYVVNKKEDNASLLNNGGGGESLLLNGNAPGVNNNAATLKCSNASQHHITQMSLLKPMAQRMPSGQACGESVVDVKASVGNSYTTANVDNNKQQQSAVHEEEKPIELPVSSNVKMSRMNLRQALKKARTETLAAQAAARGPPVGVVTVPQVNAVTIASRTLPPPLVPVSAPHPSTVPLKKSTAPKTRTTRASTAAAAAAAVAVKSLETSSSSEDSTPERGTTPPHPFWPYEEEETRTQPEEYGQEMFLRLFGLFTPEMHAQMQQRRSKRRRRNVANNARSYYHYGRIDYTQQATADNDKDKKKRKAFLLSPQVKRALPNKRAKRRSADKNEDVVSVGTSAPPSRSGSSSPDDKHSCNECLKSDGLLEQCEECKSYYHLACHSEESSAVTAVSVPTNFCPACRRTQEELLKQETQQNEMLHNVAQELELQLAKEKDRRAILQRTSKLYKIQMNNLFKIVNTIKSDQEEAVYESPE